MFFHWHLNHLHSNN